jgi:hypothetical protein
MPVQDVLKFSDLAALNSSPDSVKQKFTDIYGKAPDGIALNNETYFNAVQPPITQTYGHPCYKTLGDFTITQGGDSTPGNVIVGENEAVNQTDHDAEISLTVQGAWSEETTWSTQITAGLTFTTEFTVQGVFKAGLAFSISTTVGQSKSTTVNRTASSAVTVKVPPHSRVKVQMTATMQEQSATFSAPVTAQGTFGANFPDRVQDHYFWFVSAAQVLNATSGTLSGAIKSVAAISVRTLISDPTSL